MKKLIYTVAFVAFISIAGQAQTDKPAAKQEPAKKEAAASHEMMNSSGNVKEEKATEPKTRMAINEKGVPAAKTNKGIMKEEKAASPEATEKK